MAITLIKEDGSGLSDANVYADESDLATAAELEGFDLTPYDAEKQKSALWIAANKYIDRLHEFNGDKVQETQGMKLYTDLVTFADAGKDIIQANVEAAILHLQGYLFVAADTQDAKGAVSSQKDKVDVIETETTYEEGTRVRIKYNTSTIDALLAPYVKPGTGGVALRVV